MALQQRPTSKSFKSTAGGFVEEFIDEQFEPLQYDVTNCLTMLFRGRTTLFLYEDTVSIQDNCLCNNSSTEVPYGEVGNVNQLNTCFCCSTLSGDFLPSVSGDGVPAISPGFGCEGEKVSVIVKELRRRVRLRGDIAVKKRADEQSRNIKVLSEQVSNLESKLDSIMSYFDIQHQQQQQHHHHQQHHQALPSRTAGVQQQQPLPQPMLPPSSSSPAVAPKQPMSSTIERS